MMSHNFALKKLLTFKILKYPYIQSYAGNVAYRYLSVFNKKLKYISKINNYSYLPLVNFHTSKKYESSEEEDLSQPLVKMTFITHEGDHLEIEGRVGMTIMQAAVKNNVPMEAACEGQLACTTCHVYVEESSKKYFKDATTEEEDLLDSAPFCKPNSRLSCQLKVTEELHNAKFQLPAATSNFSVDGKEHKKQYVYYHEGRPETADEQIETKHNTKGESFEKINVTKDKSRNWTSVSKGA